MAFDIEGAREGGYSDSEIVDYLAPKSKFDVSGARQGGYSDAEILSHLATKSAPKQEAKPENNSSDLVRGFTSYGPAIQETLGGAQTLLGLGAEKTIGQGAVSNYLMEKGAKNLKESGAEQQRTSKPTDEFTTAWEQGIGAVITDWLPYQIGSGAANLLESVAVAAVGSAAGTALVPGVGTVGGGLTAFVSKQLVKKGIKEAAEQVLKERGKDAAEAFIQAESKKIVSSEIAALTERGAKKLIGSTAAIGVQAGLHGTGEVTSAAVQEAEKQGLTARDIDLSRVVPAAAIHSVADFISTKIGLGALDGLASPTKNMLFNIVKSVGITTAKEIPPELLQSAMELYGAGLPLDDQHAIKNYINTAAATVGMSVVPGVAGGLRTSPQAPGQELEAPPAGGQPLAQEPFKPTVIPPAYSTQEGIDRATGVNAESAYTQADLLTPGAEGVREQAQRMATQDLNAVGTPRVPMNRIAAQQAAFARADQEQGFTDQRQPMPVSPSQAVPYTAPAPVTNEERRKLADAQSAELARAQNEPFEFDRRRLEASASAVGGTGQVRGTPRAVLADPNPMVPRAARQRLAVMKEDAVANGEDPNALVIVPHPTMGGRFAIEKRTMEQPYVAPPIETPTVSQAEANKSLESIDAESIKNEYLAQKDIQTLGGKRGKELAKNVPSNELAPFVQAHQTLRRNIEENIVNRNGVATPEEARIINEQALQIPYDSIAEIAEDKDVPLNTKSKRLLEVEEAFDKEKRKHLKEMYGPEFFEQFGVPEAAPKQASAEFTGKFLNPEGRTAPSRFFAVKPTPEPFGQRSDAPQASQYAGKLEVSEDGRYEQLPFQQKTDAPKIQTFNKGKYSLQDVVATPEAKAMADEVRKKLLPVLKRFGLEKMGLRLVDSISNGAEGMYFKSIITLALDSNNPMGVMRHEVIHALKELGAFTNGEWKVLTDMAKKQWINQFYSPKLQAEYKAQYEKDGDTTQTFDEYMAEEAIAQAFRFYTETKPPSGMIANLMRRLNNVFTAIREFFMGNGVTDAEQLFLAKSIFSNIESGRMTAGRAGVGKEGAPKFSKSMQPTGDITPMSVQGIRIYNKEIETLTKKIGDRIAGMTSEQTVADVRKAVKKLQSYTAKGLEGREWYERSAKAVLDAFNGDPVLAEKLFQIIAITSANTEVSANFTKTVNAWNQFAQGKPIKVGTQDTNKKIEALLYFGVDWEGRKTNTFYTNLLEAMDGKDTGRSTIDLHMTRMIFDKDQPTDAQYELAEKMVSLLAAKMNVPPRQVQAASWVTQKAKGMFADYRRRGLKSDLNDNELREFAFERAVTDYSHLMKAKVKQLPITKELSEPSPSIRARTQVITGEAIPSVKTEMSQMEEMSFPQKEKFTKDVLKSGAISKLADALGIKSRIRVTVGSGAYEGKVNPNLKVQVVNSNSANAEKDARDLAYAMSYVFKQDATPFFRADPNLLNKDQYGIAFKFNRELTPAMQKKILGVMNAYLGADAGFSKVNPNEIVMINYRGEDGNPFLMSDVDYIDAVDKAKTELNKLVPIENSYAFGAKSEYPYHDWQEDGAGNAIVERLQVSRADRPDLQERLNNLRESFVNTAREAVEKTGAKPRFSLRPEQLALRPSDSGGSGISFNDRKEDAVSYAGSHYGKTKTNILSGGYYGTGLRGAESKRLAQAKDSRIGKRIYFYIPRANGAMPMRESGVGNHVYTQKFDNILGPGETMSKLYKKAQGDSNAFESFVIDNGYDGYAVPDYGMMVVLNNDIEAKYEGTVGEVHYGKTEPEKGARFSRALGALEPATFLVPDTKVNNTGNLGMMPETRDIKGKPIRLAVGLEDAATSKGYGANHILKRIEKDTTRKPPEISKELLEDLIRNVEKTAQSFTRLYRDRNNLIAYNPITTESLILAERPDHYSVITSYRQNNMGKYGNIAWTGKAPQPEKAESGKGYQIFVELQKGIPVKAGASGVVRQPVATTFKQRKVMSPEAIQEMADDLAKTKLQGKASLRTPPALLKQTLTDSFKRWFGKSAIVDMNGDPKLMYHGTARDITEFRAKQAGAIFVTDKAGFAEDFTDASQSYMIKELFNGMSEGEKIALLKKALKLAKKDKSILKQEAANVEQYIKTMPDSTFGMVPSGIEAEVRQLLDDALPSRRNILPVFVRAERPFDYQNPQHIAGLREIYGDEETIKDIKRGNWQTIESPDVQEAIRYAGYDGFYIMEGGVKNLAVYEPNQLKSAIGNTGAFSPESNDIRYSLKPLTKLTPEPTTGKVVNDAIKAIQGDNGFRINYVDRASALRQVLSALPRFNEETKKLRADQLWNSQVQAQNIIKNGLNEGVPIVQADGTIGIEKSDNNLGNAARIADTLDTNATVAASKRSGRSFVAEIARILRGEDIIREDADNHAEARRKLTEADTRQAALTASIVTGADPKKVAKEQNAITQLRKDAKEALDINREKEVTPEHIAWAKESLKAVPKVQDVLDIWKNVNTSLLKLYLDTGKINQATYDKYVANKYYVPLFKSAEDMNADGSFGWRGSGVKRPDKFFQLKGAKNLERNMWENVDKQYAAMIASAYENQTRRTAVQQMRGLDAKNARTKDELKQAIEDGELPEGTTPNLAYQDGGQDIEVFVEDTNILAAFQSMNYVLTPAMKFFSFFSNILRVGALFNPMFWIKQLVRDSTATTITGGNFVTPVHSAAEFLRIILQRSEEYKILASRGIVGPIDNVMSLNEYIGSVGKEKKSAGTFMNLVNKALFMHEASDAATKVAVFKQAKAEAIKKGLTGENAIDYAVHKARESINFSITGNSPLLNNLRHMIPFMSATIVGLDTVYRAMKGYGLNPEEKAKAQRTFATRAFALFTMSLLYAMMLQGDDDYKDLPDHVKDNSYLFPLSNEKGKKFLEIPITYEIGYMFKTLPELMVRYMAGTSTGKEIIASAVSGFIMNVPMGGLPIPQAVRPALEVVTNHSFFTGRTLEGMGDQKLPVAQRGDKASEVSKFLSGLGLDKVGLSPVKLDTLTKGYFAEFGSFANELIDAMVHQASGKSVAPKNIQNQPFFKSFLTDPYASKAVSDFYKIEGSAQETANLFSKYKSQGNVEGIKEIIEDKDSLTQLGVVKPLGKIQAQMTKVKNAIKVIENSKEMPPAEKRQKMNELQDVFNQLGHIGSNISADLKVPYAPMKYALGGLVKYGGGGIASL